MVVDKNFGNLIMGFILILVGVILFVQLADNIFAAVTLTDITNESLALTSGAGVAANADITSFSFFGNGTNSTDGSEATIGVEVNVSRNGSVAASTVVFADGTYNLSYLYEGTEYVVDSSSRTILPLTNIFFALAVFLGGFGSKILYKTPIPLNPLIANPTPIKKTAMA